MAANDPKRVEIDVARISNKQMRDVSGPGLRTFENIAREWDLKEGDKLILLGHPARSTYYNWVQQAKAGQNPNLPLDTLLRISGILGIYKALCILFVNPDEALIWLKGPHQAPLFGDQSPMDLMLSGLPDGIMAVRRYLDAWRGGKAAGHIAHLDIEPITEMDLIVG